MDDESIENRCAPSGDGRVDVPSAIPVSTDDGLFGGWTRKQKRERSRGGYDWYRCENAYKIAERDAADAFSSRRECTIDAREIATMESWRLYYNS